MATTSRSSAIRSSAATRPAASFRPARWPSPRRSSVSPGGPVARSRAGDRAAATMPEGWNPDQYLRFQAEREQPFWDLLALVRKKPGMRVCDLGCGTGALTAKLHRELSARETIGVDSSAAMLSKAPQTPGLRFIEARIEDFDLGQFDL